jgi:transglutaminase-like putative cysteine protease
MLKGVIAISPSMKFELVLADRETALAKVNPPQLIAQLLVKPDRPVASPFTRRTATYELRLIEQAADSLDEPVKLELPSVGYQRVVQHDDRSVRVRIDLDKPVPSGKDKPTDVHRRASALINSEDPKIVALVGKAMAGHGKALNDRQKAAALCQFVNQYINERSLAIGFASASEVAETREGDCSEFAVLLAAMLRAAGLPSRTASGLIYAERFLGQKQVFGYHMWAQAWIGTQDRGRWVDFDATRNPQRFDATHITVSTSALADDFLFNDAVKLAPLLGRLTIRVLP